VNINVPDFLPGIDTVLERMVFIDPAHISIQSLIQVNSMSYVIKNVMTTNVVTVDIQDTVFEAADAMERDPDASGYVVVLQHGKPCGIVTERDIIHKVIAQQQAPATTTVESIMSRPLITIDPDADFLQAPELMQAHHVSKLVVVKDDILYGVITAKVVAAQCTTYVHQTVKDMIRWTGFGF
jgi:CBS domain-containing protein